MWTPPTPCLNATPGSVRVTYYPISWKKCQGISTPGCMNCVPKTIPVTIITEGHMRKDCVEGTPTLTYEEGTAQSAEMKKC